MTDTHRSATRLLFLFSFLTASTYVVTRAMAISTFLARVGAPLLPACILGAALTVIVLSMASAYLGRHLRPVGLVAGTWLLMAAMSALLAIASWRWSESIWALGSLYVLAEIRGCFNTIFFVTLANEAFADSDSKRPFAVAASGAPIAGVVTGVLLGLEASVAQLAPTLLLMSVLDLATVAAVIARRKYISVRRPRPVGKKQDRSPPASTDVTPQRRYRIHLSALVALKIAVLTLIGYQWKVAVGDFYGTDESRLILYFALFYAISDVFIVTLQWIVSGALLDRFGIGIALVGFPLVLMCLGIVSLFTSSVMALMILFTIGKGLHVLRRAFHDPALTAAYTVLQPNIRRETIVIVKGIIKPFAEAATGLALLLLAARMNHIGITMLWLIAIPAWLLYSVRTTHYYHGHFATTRRTKSTD